MYKLDLPQQIKKAGFIPVFHLWKLHLAPSNAFPRQIFDPGPAILIDSNNNAHKEWKVLEIVDFPQTRRYKIQYKATYIGNWNKWNANPLWQPYINFENTVEKVCEFHRAHTEKPGPPCQLAI